MFKKNYIVIALLLFAALVVGAFGTTALAQTDDPLQGDTPTPEVNRTLTVNGTGQAVLTPDIAYISIGVRTQDADAANAVADNNSQAQAIASALDDFDIAPEDVQTTNFSIQPQQEYDNDGNLTGITYVVNNTVYVTVRDLDQIGDLLNAVVDAGANTINSIRFDVEDRADALSTARLAAVESARAQAEELAQAAGVELVEVQSISTYGGFPVEPAAMARMETAANTSVPISVGQLTIQVEVNIVYTIR